jgi:hypothetical protein
MSTYSAIVNPKAIRLQNYQIQSVQNIAIKNGDVGFHPTGLERMEKALKSRPMSDFQRGNSVGAFHLTPSRPVDIKVPASASDNQRRNYIQDVESSKPRRVIPATNPLAPRSIPGRSAGAINRQEEQRRDIYLASQQLAQQSSRNQQLRPIIEPQLIRV